MLGQKDCDAVYDGVKIGKFFKNYSYIPHIPHIIQVKNVFNL